VVLGGKVVGVSVGVRDDGISVGTDDVGIVVCGGTPGMTEGSCPGGGVSVGGAVVKQPRLSETIVALFLQSRRAEIDVPFRQ
jgi:hypothetical protein